MNTDKLTLWINDLRTTDAPQARRVLHKRSEGSYCCLGRLCEVAIEDGVELLIGEEELVTYDDSRYWPPPAVTNWLGGSSMLQHECSDLNDRDQKSFTEIADWLEARYANYPKETL